MRMVVKLTPLSTHSYFLSQLSSVLSCMNDLARLVGLKHVQVSEDWWYRFIDSSNFRKALVLQSRIRDELGADGQQ